MYRGDEGSAPRVVSGSTFDGAPFQITLSSGRPFARGSSAEIYRGEMAGSEPTIVAVKVFNMLGTVQKELLYRELRAARRVSIRHESILPFIGTVDIGFQKAIVSPYMRNRNLMEYFKRNSSCNTLKERLILEVAEAVYFLHSLERLVHGDLKSANVLVSDDNHALLTDFGLSTVLDESQAARGETITGVRQLCTARFAAPELLCYGADASAKPPSKTCESDVYAFGMLVLEALTEQPPWAGVLPNDISVIVNVCAGKRPPQPKADSFVAVSHSWWNICGHCWSHKPEKRPPISSVLDAMSRTSVRPGQKWEGDSGAVFCVSYFPDGYDVVTGAACGSIRIRETVTGQTLIGPLRGRHSVRCLAVSPDGREICSGDDDIISRWDAVSGKPLGKPMSGHCGAVTSVAYSPDGLRIVSGSKDRTVRLWSSLTEQPLVQTLHGHLDVVWSVAVSPDGVSIASGSWDHSSRLWNSTTGAQLGLFQHGKPVNSIFFSPDRVHIVSGSSDQTINIWNISSRQLVRTICGYPGGSLSLALSPCGQYIASGLKDGTICIWDTQTGDAVGAPLTGHTDSVRSVAFSPDGRSLVSGSSDTTVRIWDLF